MRFVDYAGRPAKVRTSDLLVSFTHRGGSLIMTFEDMKSKCQVIPVWPNGKAETTSGLGFLCGPGSEAIAVLVAVVRTLELATGYGLEPVRAQDCSIDRVYRFVKPKTAKEG